MDKKNWEILVYKVYPHSNKLIVKASVIGEEEEINNRIKKIYSSNATKYLVSIKELK